MKFHPNPASNQLFIAFPSFITDHQLSIFDSQGALKRTIKNTNPQIDLTELPAGLYHLEIVSGVERWHGRFVKL